MCVIETSPVIESRRLILRAPEVSDAPRLSALGNDAQIARMTCRLPHPFDDRQAMAFIDDVAASDPRRAATFVIEHEDHGAVGVLSMTGGEVPELGYWIGRPFWGRGLATEACEAALAFVRRHWKRRAVAAGHFVDNPASGRVLTKAGFLYTGEREMLHSLARGTMVESRTMIWLA